MPPLSDSVLLAPYERVHTEYNIYIMLPDLTIVLRRGTAQGTAFSPWRSVMS